MKFDFYTRYFDFYYDRIVEPFRYNIDIIRCKFRRDGILSSTNTDNFIYNFGELIRYLSNYNISIYTTSDNYIGPDMLKVSSAHHSRLWINTKQFETEYCCDPPN